MSGSGEKEGEGGIEFILEVRRRYVYPVLIFLGRSLWQLAFSAPHGLLGHCSLFEPPSETLLPATVCRSSSKVMPKFCLSWDA